MTDALFPFAGAPGARHSVLRELVDLVNDAVRRSVTPACPAGPSVAWQAAVETTPPPRTSLLGGTARALRPAPSPRQTQREGPSTSGAAREGGSRSATYLQRT